MATPTSQPPTAPKKRAADAAADRLRKAILQGDHPAGSDLPPERELAEHLGISRLTLRAALARLESEGLVRPVHGSGNRVLDFRETGGVELLGHLVTVAQAGGALPVRLFADVLELRRFVAVEVVGLAAERGTDEDLAALRQAVRDLAAHLGDPKAFMQADLAFSRRLVAASHNFALALLSNTIIRVLEGQPGIELAFYVNPEGTVQVYDHVLSRLERREGAAAQKAARRLLARLDATILDRVRAFAAAMAPRPVASAGADQ